MKCRKCGADIIVRVGKFGSFGCCPNSRINDNHGTYQIQKAEAGKYWYFEPDPDDDGNPVDMRPY